MSTLRVSNIEAKADPSSPSVDEKLKVTNSNGDILVHIDGKTAGVTTIGINTTDRSFTVDAAQNVEFLGIVTATKFSLSGGGEITGGDGNFTGIVTSGSGDYSGGLTVGTAVTAATANFTSSLTASSANFTGNVSIAGTLTYEDVTNVDSIGIATARTGIDVTGGHIDLVDNSRIRVGTGTDLQIYHDSTSGKSHIKESGPGLLQVDTNNFSIRNSQDTEQLAYFTENAGVGLYYDNSKKLETTTTGAKVTGALEVTQEYPSIRPTLDLNFAATKTLDRRITFTRDGVGTYVDDMGIIKYASNNTPRFDHNPTTGESLGLLIEETRTNYAVYSSEFDNAAYNKYNATVSANQAVAPDGTTTADLMYPNSSGTSRGIEDVYTLPSTGIYTTSLYVKAAGLSWVQLYAVNGANRAFFNVSTGTKGSQTGGSGSFEDYDIIDAGNGWYRIYVTYDITSISGSEYYYLYFADGDGNGSVTANGTDGVYMWGLQVEAGRFPTSYIPTSGSTVIRGSDKAKITGTNFTDFYNQSEGTFIVSAKPNEPNNGSNYYFIFEAANSSNFSNTMSIGKDNGNTYRFRPLKFSNLSDTSIAYTTNSFNAAIAGSGSGDGVVAFNGTITATSTGSPSGTQDHNVLHLGNRFPGSSGGHYYGTIKSLKYYNKRLPNAQLQGLTQQ